MKQRFATLAVATVLLTLAPAWLAGPLNAQSPTPAPAAGEARLTSFGNGISLAWSPDAGRLLFTRSTGVVQAGQGWQTLSDLWEVPAAGGSPALLAANAAEPAYSPDGRSIAFLSFEADGRGHLWLLTGSQRTDLGPADWAQAPVWSRDGVSVQIRRDGRAIGVDRQGGVVPAAVTVASALPTEARAAAESPDGSRVAYLVFGEAGAELWVAGSGGAEARLLLRGDLEFFGRPAWSPDGRTLVLSRTPSGSETAPYEELWLVAADGSSVTRLSDNQQDDSLPAWSPDGRSIAFLRGGDLWLRGTSPDAPAPPVLATEEQRRNRPVPPALESIAAGGQSAGVGLAAVAALTPPATIRVIHSALNTCRPDVPVGRMDVIDFELYLKWVVPTEVPASWPANAVKAQAVAARSYAWLRVLTHATWDFDVTDWTEYQAMCPQKYEDAKALVDAAVDGTRGQYVSYLGAVANAMYSAENSDPTLTNSGTAYLTAVDDPVAFGRTRNGHGWGMSQWGAYRWAAYYGWNYQQILAHYYTGVVIQLPGGAADTRAPLGSLLTPWPNWWVNSNRTLLTANASDDWSGVASVSFTGAYSNGSTRVTSALSPSWDLTAIPDQAGIVVTTTVRDTTNNSSSSVATWGLDRTAPTGSIAAPAFTAIPTVTLSLSAAHTGPAGPVSMTLSNDWRWSALSPLIGHDSGRQVADADSLYDAAWQQLKSDPPNSRSFGPFTTLALGKGYRAWFRLKTDNVATTSEVAYLEVIDNGNLRVLGLKRVRGIDFRQANVYQDFFVDFYLDYLQHELEFPLTFRGAADLWYDRVMATTFPAPLAATATWTVPTGEGPKQVQARYVDGAGNISPDYNATVTLDASPPTAVAFSPAVAPATNITVTWVGTDTVSGVANYDVQVRDGDGPWLPLLAHTTALSAVYSGISRHTYSFRARATDNAGNAGAYREAGDTSTLADGELALRPLATGWNLVSVPVSPTIALTAQGLMDSVAASGGSAVQVAAWQDGGWLVRGPGGVGADFPLEAGRGYFVRAAAPSTWGFAGLSYTAPFTVSLDAGWNLVSVPQGSSVTTAQKLAQRIEAQGGAPRQVLRWRAGAWDGYLVSSGAAGFAIEPGRGYFVYCENPCVWSPLRGEVVSLLPVVLLTHGVY